VDRVDGDRQRDDRAEGADDRQQPRGAHDRAKLRCEEELTDDRQQEADAEQCEVRGHVAGTQHLDDGLHGEEREQRRADERGAQANPGSSRLGERAAEPLKCDAERDQADADEGGEYGVDGVGG
jgi:hypothetical protein